MYIIDDPLSTVEISVLLMFLGRAWESAGQRKLEITSLKRTELPRPRIVRSTVDFWYHVRDSILPVADEDGILPTLANRKLPWSECHLWCGPVICI